MITIASNVTDRETPLLLYGFSTDEKPVDTFQGIKITNGSALIEIDTKKVYLYSVEHWAWY